MKSISFVELLDHISSSKSVGNLFSVVDKGEKTIEIEGSEGALTSLLIAKTSIELRELTRMVFIVVPRESDADELAMDLQESGVRVMKFPGWGTVPYRELNPFSAVFSERVKILSELAIRDRGSGVGDQFDVRYNISNTNPVPCPLSPVPCILIIPQRALLTPVPPPEYIKNLLVVLKTNGEIDTALLAKTLVSYGYIRVPRVQAQGEFALRGEVFDICMGSNEAYRVLFDFDKIESIKRFDTAQQGTVNEKYNELVIHPMKEVIWTDDRIEQLEKNLSGLKEVSDCKAIIEHLIINRTVNGEEIFYPLAFKGQGTGDRGQGSVDSKQSATLLDYLGEQGAGSREQGAGSREQIATLLDYLGSNGTLILVDKERLENAQEVIEREYQSMYMKNRREKIENRKIDYPLPDRILLKYSELIEKYTKGQGTRDKGQGIVVSKQRVIQQDELSNKNPVPCPLSPVPCSLIAFKTIKGEPLPDTCNINLLCEPARSFFGNIDYLTEEFSALLKNGWKIAVAAESAVQAERIEKMFEPFVNSGVLGTENLFIMSTPFSAGFSLPDIKFMLIQENEIFGRRNRSVHSLKTALSSPIDTFVELNPGDYVVHVNHGIGLFKGIERLTSSGHERDYIKIEYADEEMVFVPVEQVNLVQRYIGNEGQPPRLDTIGSKSWENRKGKVKKSVEDIAHKLVDLYSKRKQARGFAFGADTEWQTMFEAAFPFEETEDQLRCIREVKQDMEASTPMDRLVCGDVGYGKTEVAVRACFKAVMSGKQAAFLAPTTILVEQHYENFLERFSRFPVNIAMLSRFVDKKKARIVLQQLKNGEIDLLVGTHRMIQKDVQFKNLGLLVIDEEQRFGVKDKERLKEIKTNVDCLTLSATPIPRTLHMSLVKIRDMSLLATAPLGRHPIETFVEEYDNNKIAQAIRAEVERGGQVFFLHNRIETLRDTRIKLEKLVPEMLIETAHGQMEGKELEDIMRRFIHGGFHVLVSTTIIENGIDIPNVNTIIIDRADMYGVSQLYQLRGRVGRSDRVAYAYLFYPKEKSLSEIAMKRLQTISDFTELGSGFKIAMKDMEIRGAGNLLGREQSGYIYAVGFDLYLRLLEEAVKRLENSDYEAEPETLLELEYSGFIPDTYIDSLQSKMEVYKMIAAITEKEELERVYAELTDRFGPLPDEVQSLLALAEIRIICRTLAVTSLKERGGVARIEFAKVSRINVERLVRMIKESLGKVKVDPKKPNVILLATGKIGLKEKSEFIREKLSVLAG